MADCTENCYRSYVFSPRAIGRSIVTVLNLGQSRGHRRRRRLRPQAVIDAAKAIEPRMDIPCIWIICAAVHHFVTSADLI